MARVHVVQAARKPQPQSCATCGRAIEKGDRYRWAALRIGRMSIRKVWCADHYPKQSQLTSSDKLGQLYAGQEDAESQIASAESVSDIAAAVESLGDVVREVAEGYRESASNIEDGFGHPTSMSEEIEGKADELDSWADEIDSFDAQDAYDTAIDDAEDAEDEDGTPEIEALDACREAANEVVSSCPL